MSIVPAANPLRTPQLDTGAVPPFSGGISGNDSRSWQRQLAEAIRSPSELLAALKINSADAADVCHNESTSGRSFPTLVPLSFLQRMEPGNPRDPLLLQVLATASEDQTVAGFIADPVGDGASRTVPGLLQKYVGRALLIATGACAVHCRYCFRREYPYHEEPRRSEDWKPAMEAIATDPTITEVILSGGDPLMLNDDQLRVLCEQIDAVPHVERIRIHSRLPIVLPDRVNSEFLSLLTSLRSQAVVVVHANHGNEIVNDCRDALRSMVGTGIPVLNQAVLLRDINDSVDAMESLCRRLVNIGVMPYYLHQLDRVQGAAHFEVAREIGLKLIQELSARLPGYAVPKFVEEVAGEPNKTSIRS